jgi:nucleoside-diphosphate-sugar epimerase
MPSNTMIAVIGGTGKSGKFLIRELIRQNIPFRLLLHNQSPADPFPAPIVRGSARDLKTILELCAGCNAIISTLGQPKDEPAIFSQATRNVLAAMRTLNIKRYILTTGLNVDTLLDKKSPLTQAATKWMREHYPETTADKQLEFELLAASDLDWTLVRLPMIGLTGDTDSTVSSLEDCPGTGIHGTDLARFLIRQLKDREYIRHAPFVANKNPSNQPMQILK